MDFENYSKEQLIMLLEETYSPDAGTVVVRKCFKCKKPFPTWTISSNMTCEKCKESNLLKFTQAEQNALAFVCEIFSNCAYPYYQHSKIPDQDKLMDVVLRVLDTFPSINWGDLYDRFHRSGINLER